MFFYYQLKNILKTARCIHVYSYDCELFVLKNGKWFGELMEAVKPSSKPKFQLMKHSDPSRCPGNIIVWLAQHQ